MVVPVRLIRAGAVHVISFPSIFIISVEPEERSERCKYAERDEKRLHYLSIATGLLPSMSFMWSMMIVSIYPFDITS